MGSTVDTLRRMDQRVSELIAGFAHYTEVFDNAPLFIGPSLYFHHKTLDLRRRHTSASSALGDDAFFESLYATLTAWGMHRMGPGPTKLADLNDLKDSFRQQADRIQQVEALHIEQIATEDVAGTAQLLWDIIAALHIGVGQTKIVGGSKALHHLLPDLVPPIDREYTLRFFYGHTTVRPQEQETKFKEMYPRFHRIAVSCSHQIQERLGPGMNTSVTKVIDNAIVGYALEKLKGRRPS